MVEIEIDTPDGETRQMSLPRLATAAKIEWTHPPRRARDVLTFERLDGNTLLVKDFFRALSELGRDSVAVVDVAFVVGPLEDLLLFLGHRRGAEYD